MNPIWNNIVVTTVANKKGNNSTAAPAMTGYRKAKNYRNRRLTTVRHLKDTLLILFGILSASFGLKGFLLTNHFIDGGATGISLLLTALSGLPLPIFVIVVNIPFVLLGLKTLGRQFAIKTALAISGLALCVATVSFPDVTQDNLLVAVFGGFFLGAGIGLAVRGGAVIDGTEVLAIFLSRKLGTTMGDIVLAINVVIFGSAAYLLSLEIAMYSMITYLAASKTLDFIIEGIDEYTGVTIVSTHNAEIRDMITEKIGRGVTVYSGKTGYGKRGSTREVDIVYSVITRLEINRLQTEVQKIDPNAFMVMNPVKDVRGGMIKRKSLEH